MVLPGSGQAGRPNLGCRATKPCRTGRCDFGTRWYGGTGLKSGFPPHVYEDCFPKLTARRHQNRFLLPQPPNHSAQMITMAFGHHTTRRHQQTRQITRGTPPNYGRAKPAHIVRSASWPQPSSVVTVAQTLCLRRNERVLFVGSRSHSQRVCARPVVTTLVALLQQRRRQGLYRSRRFPALPPLLASSRSSWRF